MASSTTNTDDGGHKFNAAHQAAINKRQAASADGEGGVHHAQRLRCHRLRLGPTLSSSYTKERNTTQQDNSSALPLREHAVHPMTTSTITSSTGPPTTTTPPTPASQEAHLPKPIALILGSVFGALALLVVLIAGIILLRRCMNEQAERPDRRPEVAASLWSTKPSKAPLTPFILQPSKQTYHALPRHAYGANLQADYTSFLLSPPHSAPSSNVPSTTSRPSTVYTAKHTDNASHAQSSSLSDPFASSSSRPSLSSPSPRPSTSPSPSSTPRPSTTSASTPSAIIDALPHLKAHLQAPRDHLPSSKAHEAMLMHSHSHRRDGSAVSLATSSSTTSTLTTARMSANGTDTSRTSTNAGRRWEDEDTLPPGYVL